MRRQITVTAEVDTRDVLDEIDTEDLKEEIAKRIRNGSDKPNEKEIYSPEEVLEWFESPFVSDFDKMQVLNNIKDTLILNVDYIKNNL